MSNYGKSCFSGSILHACLCHWRESWLPVGILIQYGEHPKHIEVML